MSPGRSSWSPRSRGHRPLGVSPACQLPASPRQHLSSGREATKVLAAKDQDDAETEEEDDLPVPEVHGRGLVVTAGAWLLSAAWASRSGSSCRRPLASGGRFPASAAAAPGLGEADSSTAVRGMEGAGEEVQTVHECVVCGVAKRTQQAFCAVMTEFPCGQPTVWDAPPCSPATML
ncbi:uncharacterized protein [Equus przewalskii]|uniref:Uncharacterized protein isoform X2 n=1 Tax=Equus przewalskii TaxID=9798 RepID=A0ABM4P461_EQUPR